MDNTEAKIQEVLEALKIADGIYKREAVEAAVVLREEITPYLIGILEDALAHPNNYIDEPNMAHIYAFILLGFFQETQAHRVMVDLFSLPKEFIDPMYGDLITEDLKYMLFRTCGGSVDQIKRLILNKEAYEYCRGAALEVLTYAVVEDIISREAALEFLGSLFTGNEDDNPDSLFWTFVADAILQLYPEELMPLIQKAFDDNKIDRWFFGPETFIEALEHGKEQTLQKLREELESRSFKDIHAYMSWWAMFDQEEKKGFNPIPNLAALQPPARLTGQPGQPVFKSTPNLEAMQPQRKSKSQEKAKKKKKRKMAKASKKKNRR